MQCINHNTAVTFKGRGNQHIPVGHNYALSKQVSNYQLSNTVSAIGFKLPNSEVEVDESSVLPLCHQAPGAGFMNRLKP